MLPYNRTSDVDVEMIVGRGNVIGVLMEHCQSILNGRGMPADWAMGVAVVALKWKKIS